MTCYRCKKVKHINDFYGDKQKYFHFFNAEEGIDCWYGRPQAWCKQCMKDHRLGIPAGIDDLVT